MDLEGILVSKISQTKTNTVGYHLYMESKKYNRLPNITKKKESHTYRKQTNGCQHGGGGGGNTGVGK